MNVLRRCGVLALVLISLAASAQEDLTPPPLPPPDETAPQDPNQQPYPTQQTQQPTTQPQPAPRPPAEGGARFGPMGSFQLYNVNGIWDGSGMLPGFGGTLGLRFALLPRHAYASQFNVGVGAFFGLESVNFFAALSPGLRVELMGVRTHSLLIPYLSLSAFGQVVIPVETYAPFVRAGFALSWNLAAAFDYSAGSPFLGLRFGGGDSWFLIPVAIIAGLIAFGDVRVYVQQDPRSGALVGGLSIGVGF